MDNVKLTVDEINALLAQLEDKDTTAAYKALQELEQISDETGMLYPYTDRFAAMTTDDRYVMRVRGFRLFCKQAKWDTAQKLDEHIKAVLAVLHDVKPTAVRQALAALHDVMKYKPELREIIAQAASSINCTKYKETMQGLIAKDILDLLAEE